jgi:hypothetical protein
MHLCGIDPVGAAVGENRPAGRVVANEPDARQGEWRTEAGEILEDVIGRATVARRLGYDGRQRVLRGPSIDDLQMIDNPVSTRDDSGTHGAMLFPVWKTTK